MNLLITGGLQRKNASELGDGMRFHTAKLCRFDWENGKSTDLLSLDKPNEFYPDEYPNLIYTCATLENKTLYLCSETELFIYQYPEMKLLKSASFPFMQNVHHVTHIGQYIVIVSTGLDLVVLLDDQTLQPLKFINSQGKEPWSRFSQNVDYRKVHSTKPHESHPNFAFSIDGDVWVTRFHQKDAICLGNSKRRIDIGVERIHDGHVVGDYVYFSCVNGLVVIVNKHTLKVDEIIDLNKLEVNDVPLGWCRGLCVHDDQLFVGFSKLRNTSIKDNIKWALGKLGVKEGKNTRIIEYDLANNKKVKELDLPGRSSDVIYSIIKV